MTELRNLALASALACLTWAGAGCAKPESNGAATNEVSAAAPALKYLHLDHALPKLRTIQLWVGPETLETEVALDVREIATGMMFRTNMAENAAMLFVFDRPEPRAFYMKNCVVPLSAAYVNPEGVIDQIVDLQPGVIEPVPSRSPYIQFVIEVRQGWFARHHITTGMVVNTSVGRLREVQRRLAGR